MNNKLLYVDTETTGLDPVKNDIIQIAGIIEIDGVVKEEFEYKVRPFNPENATPEALKIHGYSLEQIKEFPKPIEAYAGLRAIFGMFVDKFNKQDKFTPVGFNVGFDLDFLKQFFTKNGDPYWGSWVNWKKVDPLYLLYYLNYIGELHLPDYKLETACKFFDIEIKAHDALSDIKATKELLTKINNKWKGGA